MICKCGGETRVVDSRHPKPHVVKRVRLCEVCGERFPTFESREVPTTMKPRRKGASTEAWRKKVEADPEWYRQNRKRSSLRRKARMAAQALGRPVREIYQQWGVA